MDPSIVISLASLAGMIIFGVLTAVRGQGNDVRDQLEKAKKEAAANAKIEMSLDSIKQDTGEIRSEQRTMRLDMNDYGKRLVIVEQSAKSAHHRIDRIDDELGEKHRKEQTVEDKDSDKKEATKDYEAD